MARHELLFAFAVVVMPGLRSLDDGAFIRAFQTIDRVIQNNQPLFMLVWVGSVLSVTAYHETFVRRAQHRIHVREYPGEEPAIVLMHGFPDNLHLYDRLYPYLSPPRRVIAFDFLGWGASDKPAAYPYTASNQVGDLDAVITQLRLQQVILVAHDASGPPAIDWALDRPERVEGLVLLNTYYCAMPTLGPPEAIWLFSTPVVRNSRGWCRSCLIIGSSIACISGRLEDSSETRRLELNSCRCCINSSMPGQALVLPSFA